MHCRTYTVHVEETLWKKSYRSDDTVTPNNDYTDTLELGYGIWRSDDIRRQRDLGLISKLYFLSKTFFSFYEITITSLRV